MPRMFKALFNLMLLAALAAGAFYAYTNVSENYELMAKIQNVKDQWLMQMQGVVDQVNEEIRQVQEEIQQKKNELRNLKRSVGL